MRVGRPLVPFIGLTVMLVSAELWLTGGVAEQGSRIVFSNLVFDNFEIYVMDADGGNRENLSNHPPHDDGSGLVARRDEDCIRFQQKRQPNIRSTSWTPMERTRLNWQSGPLRTSGMPDLVPRWE